MAETPPKRLREESHDDSSSDRDDACANSKRQKPYNNILNLLDDEDEQGPSHELSKDLSAIFTTLQQELSSSTSCDDSTTTLDFESLQSTEAVEAAELTHQQTISVGGGNEDDSVKSVMRHLLEASDDELGIPSTREENNVVERLNSGENFPFDFNDNGLWEIEDETANYYSLLQSELFM